jgi:hypothetical protein
VDARTKEGLLHLADEAMYLVKNTNRDSVAAANMGILQDTVACPDTGHAFEDEVEADDAGVDTGETAAQRLERRRSQ